LPEEVWVAAPDALLPLALFVPLPFALLPVALLPVVLSALFAPAAALSAPLFPDAPPAASPFVPVEAFGLSIRACDSCTVWFVIPAFCAATFIPTIDAPAITPNKSAESTMLATFFILIPPR